LERSDDLYELRVGSVQQSHPDISPQAGLSEGSEDSVDWLKDARPKLGASTGNWGAHRSWLGTN
jgi:hypothetical protein